MEFFFVAASGQIRMAANRRVTGWPTLDRSEPMPGAGSTSGRQSGILGQHFSGSRERVFGLVGTLDEGAYPVPLNLPALCMLDNGSCIAVGEIDHD